MQCYVHYIHWVEFYFQFGHLITFLVKYQLSCGCRGERSWKKNLVIFFLSVGGAKWFFKGPLRFLSWFLFEVVFIFEIIFIFEIVFIFEVVFILKSSSFWGRLHFWVRLNWMNVVPINFPTVFNESMFFPYEFQNINLK